VNKIVFWLALIVALRASAFIYASLQLQLGNPSNAAVDTNNHNHYLIQRAIEALDYNDSRGQANWASWDLTSGDANTTALDFSVKGVVTQVSTNAIPVAPILSLVTFTNNQFHFTILGTMAYSYAIESSTNLSDWISIVTNSSPFAFTDTNFSSGALRFYRARFVP